ncbi:hypothetical protein CC80DRAFT_555902 [Byssothecium circinans]|uniref:Uncharacterized protein n=1 Tax=Byssothecium circinans TaxID=147558 RepID=A0A6A5T9V3_9PLEO|nr:hypothetical protein CC80DRAFT_555902 [Byssothecium circinans]
METRDSNNLQHNEMVSESSSASSNTILRSLDPAFESRIDISLNYSTLTFADHVGITENALEGLATWEFNGRQIESAIKTEGILAAKKEPLNAQHLRGVLTLRSKTLGPMDRNSEEGKDAADRKAVANGVGTV